MSTNSDNRRRAFADVVTIDAWHDGFDSDRPSADLHADVVFGTARVGGTQESLVRFRLSVKRAEVVVVIPDSEPVSIDRKSVSRDAPTLEGQLTKVVEYSNKARSAGKLRGFASPTRLVGDASVEAEVNASISEKNKLEVSATIQFMMVTQSMTSEGHYRWIIEPTQTKALDGRPWDATKYPRLRLVDKRKDRNKGIPPTVRVEVRCRREDLIIEGLEVKDEGLWATMKRRVGFKNRMAAAESYIRDHLSQEGLEVSNIEDMFGQVTLGATTAESA